MKQSVMEYIKGTGRLPVSPIWGGEKEFPFLCLGHLEIAEAMGFELRQATPVLKIVKEGQMPGQETLFRLICENRFDSRIFENEVSFLKSCKGEQPEKLLGGGCFGPLTVVSDVLGAERLLRDIAKDRKFVKEFVAYVTELLMELARREREVGADFFWIAEPLASLLSPKNFWEFSGIYLKRIFETAEVPGFLHVCGKTLRHTKYMEETTAQVLSIDSCTDIGACIRMVKEDTVIMGNVNPSTLRFGSREDIREEVRMILERCAGFPNLILSTGCSTMEGTPDENVQILFEAAGKAD